MFFNPSLIVHSTGMDGLSDMTQMNTKHTVSQDFINNMGVVPLLLRNTETGEVVFKNLRPGALFIFTIQCTYLQYCVVMLTVQFSRG